MSNRVTTAYTLGLILDRNPILIDVRTPAEFEACHPVGARNHPLDRLNPEDLKASLNGCAEEPLYLMCQGGTRARMAQERLDRFGIANTVVVEGGLTAWLSAGLPVVEGVQRMSVERQARILIGLMVILGVVVGWWIHPIGFALAGMVGAGLVLAGATDSCAIALLLSRAPWNQKSCPPRITACSP